MFDDEVKGGVIVVTQGAMAADDADDILLKEGDNDADGRRAEETVEGGRSDKDGANEDGSTVREVEEKVANEAAETGKTVREAAEVGRTVREAASEAESAVICIEERGKAVMETLGGSIVSDGSPMDGVIVIEGIDALRDGFEAIEEEKAMEDDGVEVDGINLQGV